MKGRRVSFRDDGERRDMREARNSTLGRVSQRDTSAESERKVSGSQGVSGRKLARATDVFCFVSAGAKSASAKRRVGVVR